ncbi:MAG: response regulator [Candidatus Omnitrophica bacterium]|nr:response regulator [Candidatus Omnitrophota bacterium]
MNKTLTKTGGHILIVDDVAADRDLFKYLLDQAGFITQTASDGAEAFELLGKKDFDLVLCDYLMPMMDGYEFLQKVRQRPEYSHIIVIMITSDESEAAKIKLLKGGANDFVRKGDSHDEILARLRVHLSAQAAQADRKVLEMACDLADEISQPLSVMVAVLDVLGEKVRTDLPAAKAQDLQGLINSLNKEAEAMVIISKNLKKLSMGIHKQHG